MTETLGSGGPTNLIEIGIDSEATGLRLDRALQQKLPDLSRSRLKKLILSGQVARAGAASPEPLRDPAQRVHVGENFILYLPGIAEAQPASQPMPLDILFEDADLIVVNKRAGMVVHPAPGNPDGTLVNALLAHCGSSLAGIGGVRRPGIVHRLDKDTSGLLVAAKTEAAHQSLSRDFALHRIERAYHAIVWGVPAPASGEISGNIGRSAVNRKKMAVVGENRGKPAVTRYRIERRFDNRAAQLQCRLSTGRTHQIRVHLAHRGHPLIGDPAYGARGGRAVARSGAIGAAIAEFPRQALHAYLLGFTHPTTGEQLRFESPLPADMKALIANLELL